MDNQETLTEGQLWNKIKDHVARNKGKYAALAGAALAGGVAGYAAGKPSSKKPTGSSAKNTYNINFTLPSSFKRKNPQNTVYVSQDLGGNW